MAEEVFIPTIESVINGFKADYVCSKCGEKKEVNLIPYINFKQNPEYYALVKDLSIFKTTCEKCGNTEYIKFDLLLVDEEHKYFLYLLNDISAYEKFKYQITYFVETTLNKDGKYDLGNYKTRVVFSLNDLVEKMSIFEDGLRDDIIEIIKLMLKEKNMIDTSVYNEIYYDGMDKTNLVFVGFNSKTTTLKPERVVLDGKFYNKVIDTFEKDTFKNELFPRVDASWAEKNFRHSLAETEANEERNSESADESDK